jgi:hypothetical protein
MPDGLNLIAHGWQAAGCQSACVAGLVCSSADLMSMAVCSSTDLMNMAVLPLALEPQTHPRFPTLRRFKTGKEGKKGNRIGRETVRPPPPTVLSYARWCGWWKGAEGGSRGHKEVMKIMH